MLLLLAAEPPAGPELGKLHGDPEEGLEDKGAHGGMLQQVAPPDLLEEARQQRPGQLRGPGPGGHRHDQQTQQRQDVHGLRSGMVEEGVPVAQVLVLPAMALGKGPEGVDQRAEGNVLAHCDDLADVTLHVVPCRSVLVVLMEGLEDDAVQLVGKGALVLDHFNRQLAAAGEAGEPELHGLERGRCTPLQHPQQLLHRLPVRHHRLREGPPAFEEEEEARG
mmetsp:Transcript_47780/g.149754  ORF Transcript_47780/g.149754 Transcript_47780/m.149754 type:complete len:221 (-) Transcript_47780:373-1035(-)